MKPPNQNPKYATVPVISLRTTCNESEAPVYLAAWHFAMCHACVAYHQ